MGLVRPPLIGFDTKLLFRYNVFLLLGWAFISMLGYITLLYSMSDFSASIELSKTHAAAISAYLNLGTAVRRSLTVIVMEGFKWQDYAHSYVGFCVLPFGSQRKLMGDDPVCSSEQRSCWCVLDGKLPKS
jgi:hypothetical protein